MDRIPGIAGESADLAERYARICESLKHDRKDVPPSSHDYDIWDDAVTACAEAIRATQGAK